MSKSSERIARIRRKYGKDAFHKFGLRGGSPILKSWTEHRAIKGYKVSRG